jgi:uncharacterized protein (DUF58 family)
VDRHELLSKITTFPLLSGGLAEDLLSGDYRSIFKGQGIEFDEVRHYERGDDIRSIDWNVSARFGTPYVKMYREESEMTVCVVLDSSGSMHAAGGGELTRYEQGVLAAALIAFSADRAGQRVGAIFFDNEICRIFPPRKGRPHTMAVISAAIENYPRGQGSGLGIALSGVGRLLKRRSLLIVISDFLCLNWEHEMGSMARRHDLIALRISSPLDREISGGLLTLRDPETGLKLQAPTSFAGFRSAWADWHEERRALWQSICRRSGAACLELSTDADAAAGMREFFRERRR